MPLPGIVTSSFPLCIGGSPPCYNANWTISKVLLHPPSRPRLNFELNWPGLSGVFSIQLPRKESHSLSSLYFEYLTSMIPVCERLWCWRQVIERLDNPHQTEIPVHWGGGLLRRLQWPMEAAMGLYLLPPAQGRIPHRCYLAARGGKPPCCVVHEGSAGPMWWPRTCTPPSTTPFRPATPPDSRPPQPPAVPPSPNCPRSSRTESVRPHLWEFDLLRFELVVSVFIGLQKEN